MRGEPRQVTRHQGQRMVVGGGGRLDPSPVGVVPSCVGVPPSGQARRTLIPIHRKGSVELRQVIVPITMPGGQVGAVAIVGVLRDVGHDGMTPRKGPWGNSSVREGHGMRQVVTEGGCPGRPRLGTFLSKEVLHTYFVVQEAPPVDRLVAGQLGTPVANRQLREKEREDHHVDVRFSVHLLVGISSLVQWKMENLSIRNPKT